MSKPIALFKIGQHDVDTKTIDEMTNAIVSELSDYHVLIDYTYDVRGTHLQVFSDKEIDPISLENLKVLLGGPAGTKEHLQFIYDRLDNVHGENTSIDYMQKLKKIIDDLI